LVKTPWSERYMKEYLKSKADNKKFEDSVNATQVKNTTPSHPLINYTGVYSNPVYGDMTIEIENNQLVLNFRKQRSLLFHFHYDQFVTHEEHTDQQDFRLSFLT